MTESEEKKLIREAKDGNVASFEKLLKINYNKLFSFALNITGGKHADASDILQEAVIKVFLNIKKFKEKSSFSSWLWTTIRNEFINYSLSPKTRSNVNFGFNVENIEKVGDSSEKEMIVKEKKEQLRQLVAELPMKHKEIITLVEFQEMTYEETANFLGISIDSVKVRLFRARKDLHSLAVKNAKRFL